LGTDLPPLIAIVGQTATGKSALAIRLCEEIGGEIVTADSRQVYRYMDIGTDKPSQEERARVPHHMLDLVEPDESYTLALYQSGAYATIEDILSRGKVPVLAGGTPLYLNAVLEGWTIPRVEPNMALRAELESEAALIGSAALHDRLRGLDPDAAAGILPSNTRRIVRALEVIILTGEPISGQQRKVPPPYRMLEIGLTVSRDELYARIDRRVDGQVARGLVQEVEALHDKGYTYELPSMSGLGYRQIGEYLQGRATLPEAVQRIKWDTHSFARHQGNWFRRMKTAHWLDVSTTDPFEHALALTATFLSEH
jgi:tRNA dimethylallyltransferase